jgi:uncharacterized delta-60 repeat protein
MVERLESRTLLAATPTVVRDPSAAQLFYDAGEFTFFTESNGSLSVTNGTAGGTFAVRSFGKIGGMVGVGDDVYLTTDTGVWRSDGSTSGTVHVLPMYNNIDGMAVADGFTEMGGEVYFYARVNTGVTEWQYGLWKTDGTPGGTSMVRGIHSARLLTRVGDTLFFIGNDEQGTGDELWKTDGTAAGTAMVKDILPGESSGLDFPTFESAIAAVGDKLVFKARDVASSPYSLWSSDGTAGGTVQISAARPAQDFTTIGGAVYFGVAGAAAGTFELWTSDGTASGTSLVKALGSMGPATLLDAGGTLYFAGRDGTNSASLWKSDGTAAGTVRVAGPAEGMPFANIANLSEADGTIVFTATDPAVVTGAYSLWTSDGTTGGSIKVRDTFTGAMQGAPGNIGGVGSIALFTANDGVGAPELWAVQTVATPPLPEARAQGPNEYVVGEGNTIGLHGYTTGEPLPGRPLTYAWDLDGDGVFGETGSAALHGNETGADPTFNAAGLDGPSTHVVQFRISDSTGYTSTDAADITIRNGPPTLNVSGGPAVLVQGNAYTLNLSTSDGGPDTIAQWIIDWGDGVTQTLPGSTTSVTHTYPLTPATCGITVIAQDEDGEYRADRPAALDATFGAGGIVTSDVVERDDTPRGLVVQPDGKIVTVSTLQLSAQSNDTAIAINRYLPGGTLDPTFGVGGRVRFNAGFVTATTASAVALQADGRIVVAGSTGTSTGRNSLFLRLLPDGSFDPTFGDSGAVTYSFGGSESLSQVEIAPDGHIIAGGAANQILLLAQLEPDGSLDEAFGTGGSLTIANIGTIRDMVRQPDGKIVFISTSANFLVGRLNVDGTFDSTFDGDGRTTVSFGSGTSAANSLALMDDGSILIAGQAPSLPSSPQPGGNDAVVAKLTSAGALDTSFADGGRLRTVAVGPFNSGQPLQGMALPIVRALPDGRFLLSGSYELFSGRWEYVVDRYAADGAADASFAPGGRLEVDVGGTGIGALLQDLAIQPDGAPVLYGGAGTAFNPSEALVRLTPAGLSVRVVDAGQPQVSISAPATTPEAATYTLGLSGADSDGDGITQWIINWGDGAVQVVDGNPSSVTHVFADGPRAVVVKASAIDGDGSISSTSANVTVNNVAPTITVIGGAPTAEGSPYTIQFSATDPGPDTITNWTISWGDGTFSSLPASATSAQHTYMDDGTYAVTVSATDEDGTFPATPVNASVSNVAPTLDPIGDRLAAAAAGFELTFTARDVVPEIFSGTIDWGDGSAPTPFSGSATPVAANAFAINHTYAARGTYAVTVNLSDGDGGTTVGTASVHVGDVVVRVFDDVNGNGTRDAGEPPRAGATAFLDLDRDAILDAGEPTGTTDAFGDALFDNLSAAAHAARVVVPANWHLTTPTAGFIDVTPGTASAFATFGLSQAATATGTLFNDANANGVRDAGETALITSVRARRVDTNTSVTVSPDAQGVYRFTGLQPGQYVIELAFASRVITLPHGRRGHLITVTGAETEFTGLDIGAYSGTGGAVSGTLYRDLNDNGARDVGEPGVFNQFVYVDENDNGRKDPDELSALTTSSGAWSIARLPAGTYAIRQVLPSGSPHADDPAVWREVTVALGQSVSGIDLARPFEQTYYIRRSGDNIVVYNGSETGQFTVASTPATSTSPLIVFTSAADDWIIIDWTFGVPMPAGGLRIDGLSGDDTLTVIGTPSADAATFAAGQVTLGGASFAHSGFERLTFDGRGGDDAVVIAGGPPVMLAGAEDSAPRVTGVFVSGTSWNANFLNFLASSGVGDATLGYRLDASNHADELPWTNINKVSVRFSENVTISEAALAMIGVNVGQYALAPGSFDYDPDTFTATWTLATNVGADKLLLSLDADHVTGTGGLALDGEWANPAPGSLGGADAFPSGDGSAGGDFLFRLNVLPGDTSRNGIVQASDALPIQAALLTTPGQSGYTIFRDVNGNGILQANDFLAVQARLLTMLPSAEPSPPAATTAMTTGSPMTRRAMPIGTSKLTSARRGANDLLDERARATLSDRKMRQFQFLA